MTADAYVLTHPIQVRAERGWRLFAVTMMSLATVVVTALWLSQARHLTNPLLYGYLATVGSVIAFTCAGTALLRFRGTGDRIALLLALGLVVSGVSETFSGLALYHRWAEGEVSVAVDELEWLGGRTFLAALLLAGIVLERHLPQSRRQGREVAAAVSLAIAVGYFTALFYSGAAYLDIPLTDVCREGALLARPGHLIPAAFFLLAAIRCLKRPREGSSLFNAAVSVLAILGVSGHLLASLADARMSILLVLAEFLKVSGYAVLLGGTLLEHVRLFDEVRHLAASDSLTGLANYRRFDDALRAEMRRSQRTGRPFAILLLDLDGLKKINDSLGHEVGSRAICRVAEVLKRHCRSMDTAARFGGDEFALVLPETDFAAATRVAQRIREQLALDTEKPQLSVSIGVAVYPRNGVTLEALQRAADQELYAMKRSVRRKRKGNKAVSAA